jgi:hypothetical protein
MDNWDKFQENLSTANSSTGTLQEQADIYAESWEAAEDRVQAAAESIYNDLLDDNFFIALTDGFAGFLKIIDSTIDNLGGLSGVLMSIASIIATHYAQKMPAILNNLA